MVNYNTQCVAPQRQIQPKPQLGQQLGYNQFFQKKDAIQRGPLPKKDVHVPKLPVKNDTIGSIKNIVDFGVVQLKPATQSAARQFERPAQVSKMAVNVCEDLDVELCQHCGLPVGSECVRDGDSVLHKECAAECIMKFEKGEDEALKAEDAALKRSKRIDYDIGWSMDRIPCNARLAAKVSKEANAHGMWCLKFTKWNNTAALVPTLDPSAAINLEYLAIALKVRKEEGKEPLFSLDPVFEGSDLKNGWQLKRFEPAWLAGTSAGEVMFQADVYLKELSMGEYPQPVAGMKSAFEFAEAESSKETWMAREWFMVRKASVRTTNDNVLVPDVVMGVEAREQVKGSNTLDDVPVTRPDLPLVKYADCFTRYFDLIAERKSVVYNLRELAKACALAKYIVDKDVQLPDDACFKIDDASSVTNGACCLEIPSLWNERRYSDVHVEGGRLADVDKNPKQINVMGVYGGVNLGMDGPSGVSAGPWGPPGAAVTAPKAAPAPPRQKLAAESIKVVPTTETELYGPGLVAQPMVIAGTAGSGPSLSGVSTADIVKAMAPSAVRGMKDAVLGVAAGAEGAAVVPFSEYTKQAPARFLKAPRGVDLNLNMFDLSTSCRDMGFTEEDGSWALAINASDDEPVGRTFWSDIESSSLASIEDSDKAFLSNVFHPNLSDRREEGDLFKPPDARADYVRKLQKMVKEEQEMQDMRRSLFLGANFDVTKPGPAFPSSWESTHHVTGVHASVSPSSGPLYPRPDYLADSTSLANVLKSSTPVFDETTEDGMRFRIYQIGTLHVRTTTEHASQEAIGAVFSTRLFASASPNNDRRVGSQEKLTRVTQYVAAVSTNSSTPRFYVVIETENGNSILIEKRYDSQVAWQENPVDLEARNAFAKVTRVADCQGTATTVGALKSYQDRDLPRMRCSVADVKTYADGIFDLLVAA